GTGLIGSKVVQKLTTEGREGVAAAPNTGVDTVSGEGLAEALEGASVVVDVSNPPPFEAAAATDFLRTAGRYAADAGADAGARHPVPLSVVATDRLQQSGYLGAKLAQEEMIKASPIPYTLVRATQFFEFLRGIGQSAAEGGVIRLPHAQFQPMAA